MNRLPTLALTGLLLTAAPTTVHAQETTETDARASADRTDVRRYDKLITRMRQLDADYRRAKAAAKDEMRSRNGSISYQTATRVSDLKDELQLTRTQLVAVASVAGLPVPDLESIRSGDGDARRSAPDGGPTIVDHDLRLARRILLAELRAEAKVILRTVRLPITARVKR